MTTLSTHVLDAALGMPAAGIRVTVHDPDGKAATAATTNPDGRIRFDVALGGGRHSLTYGTGPYFAAARRDTLYPEVTVTFTVDVEQAHLHVALLLSPYAYTTYRGS